MTNSLVRFPLTAWLLLILACPVMAESIRVAVGISMSPYIITEEDSGAELEIVREVLALQGYDIEPVYVPYIRVRSLLHQGNVAAAMTLPKTDEPADKSIFFSDEYITYHNVAVALASAGIKLDHVANMADYRVLGFQTAQQLLGPEYGRMSLRNPQYSETIRQNRQIEMLFSGRTEMIVIDQHIFDFYRNQTTRVNTGLKVDVFDVLDPVHYRVGFRNPALRDKFNVGLQQLRQSGRYQTILDRYLK
ncbi:ABC transporter substrate-binding protein [Oceanobacter sp. 3_MG-2023]|uniref:substrate-binding periplasmic protein n=1 Tax=Oceanobacter sp. 3_MG-2023 TaxID=3062622 RepID=UPI0027332D92|nr:transporter substrate-binding domain-containing protein [Oceanobacter sp. 3_MG-2023]MDP2505464.1 transporter substrate-binding domain-containing protein [Oceanobacter sp. 3_MG-2023]